MYSYLFFGYVTLLMTIGFIMMQKVQVGRIILTCVWFFHIIYFVFGVNTIKPDLSPDTND